MKRYYQAFSVNNQDTGSSERFLSEANGVGQGVPTNAVIARGVANGADPFDPPKYWDYFPGTD